jgi:hypothetical protein
MPGAIQVQLAGVNRKLTVQRPYIWSKMHLGPSCMLFDRKPCHDTKYCGISLPKYVLSKLMDFSILLPIY